MEIEKPLSESKSSSFHDQTADLHEAPSAFLADSENGDYPPLKSFNDAKTLFYVESVNIFVGHIGDVELSAVAISLSVIANLSFGFLLGMASALETLCGQAFGAGELKMLGIYMQRSWIILTAACFCMLPLYTYSKPVLKLLGQRHDIADMAGKFSLYIIPQMFSLAVNFPTQKFLQAQSKVAILAWVGFVALVLHILVLFLFVEVFKWGLAGAAVAYDISAWGIALAQVVYIVGWCDDSWSGLSWLAFKEIRAFLKLSIASAVMLCLEIWYCYYPNIILLLYCWKR
ncbi:Protein DETOXIFICATION 34 [Orobanche gracilis]